MTIAVAGNFTEGVVFGADSAVSYTNNDGSILKVYEGAQKIYHLGQEKDCSDSPYGVMIFGATVFENQSWRNVLCNFFRNIKDRDIDECPKMAQELVNYLNNLQSDPNIRPDSGLFLAGYGECDNQIRCYKIMTKSLEITEVPVGTVSWDGMPHVVQRLILGIDVQTVSNLVHSLEGLEIELKQGEETKTVPLADHVIDIIRKSSPKSEPTPDMPLRDAIDYIHFLAYSTVKHFKFVRWGAPVCCGEIELAVITLDRGFRRIRRKPLDFCLPLGYKKIGGLKYEQ